jgi:hypothetical protein
VRFVPVLACLLASACSVTATPDARTAPAGLTGLVRGLAGPEAILAPQDRSVLQAHEERRMFFREWDPHMLPAVRWSLDNPLHVSNAGHAIGTTVRATELLSDTRTTLAPYGAAPHHPRAAEPVALEGSPGPAVDRLYAAAKAAHAMVTQALRGLSAKDREFLRSELPRFLSRSKPEEIERSKKGEEDVEGRERMLRCATLWEQVDRLALALAFDLLVRAAESSLDELKAMGFQEQKQRIETPEGPIELRGPNNGGGDDDAFIVIDFGGHDEHRMPEQPAWRPVRLVIDLSGDDLYLGKGQFAWGAALLGIALLVDAGGNDDYRGGDWSLGCGLGGYGALWDLGGRDRYYGGLGALGAGVFGHGLLVDGGGDDEYAGGLFCQGFASTGGFGALVDRAGNDTYLAGRDEKDIWRRPATYLTFAQGSAYGHRFGHIYTDDKGKRRWKMTGHLPGGVGVLFDGGGDDRYEADVFGQGAGYWYSLGLLVDSGGNDRYRATWYGQGVGTHAATGCVVDGGGDDFYFSRNTSQGCGHDFSVGVLHDVGGNDEYVGLTLCQGAGNAWSSLGLLVDERGNDTYRCGQRSWGFGSEEKRKPELAPYGILLDLAGTDRYEGRTRPQKDARGVWKQGERGFGQENR